MDSIRAAFAWLRSFGKKEWRPEDYPIRYSKTWIKRDTAEVVNWPFVRAEGDTREEARKIILERLQKRIEDGEPMPRPGTHGPAIFAPSKRIDAHGDFAYRLVKELFDIDAGFISDESTLWDFAAEEEDYDRSTFLLFDRYGYDVSHIEYETVADILDKIDPVT